MKRLLRNLSVSALRLTVLTPIVLPACLCQAVGRFGEWLEAFVDSISQYLPSIQK